jgi:WD40 repeat protein
MLDSVVRTLEKNSQIARIRKLVFCACHNRWSKDAQSMSQQELQSCLQALYDRHPTILEFKHALYQIVIKLNHSSEYYAIANTICDEIEKIYDHPPAKPTLTNPVTLPAQVVPNAIETQSLRVVHLQIQAHTVPIQVVCTVAIDGQQQIQRVIELPAALAAEYQAWQASYQQVSGQSLIDRATSPDLDRVNRSWESTGNLIAMLQRWYQSDQWQALRRQFQSFVPADAPLQIMVSNNDLPRWQLQWTDLSQAVQVQPARATALPEPVAAKPSVSEVVSETINPPAPVNVPDTAGLGTTGAIGDDVQPPTISSALAVTIPPVVEYDTLTLGQRLTGYHSEVHALAIDPQRGIIVSGHGDIGYRDNNIKVWGSDDGQLLRDLAGHSNWVQALVLTQDGLRVYSGGMDGQVLGWDVAGGQPLPFKINAESAVTSLVLAQQERHVITGTVDGQIKVWDSLNSNFLTSWFAHEGGVHSLAVTDRLLATAGEDGVARVWDSLNGTGIRQLVGHSGRVTRVAIDPTGTRVVTAGIDRTVRIWEVATGNLLHTLVGHERPINCLILTPDGQSIVSGSDDKTIKIWKLDDGRLVNNLYGHETPVLSVAVGGNSLISGGYGEIRIWDIA